MKTIIYCRTSSSEQNPENQLKDCLKLNTFGKCEIFKEQQSAYSDKISREKFANVVSAIKSRKLKHLIVWDLDRIYRNRIKLIEFFRLCKAYGCQVHSYRQQWMEDLNQMPAPWNEAMHDLMLQVMGWLAEEESVKKSSRVRAAVRKKKGVTVSYKGNKWGRRQLSSFKKNKVRELQAQGLSIRQISDQLGIGKSTVHKYLAKS